MTRFNQSQHFALATEELSNLFILLLRIQLQSTLLLVFLPNWTIGGDGATAFISWDVARVGNLDNNSIDKDEFFATLSKRTGENVQLRRVVQPAAQRILAKVSQCVRVHCSVEK